MQENVKKNIMIKFDHCYKRMSLVFFWHNIELLQMCLVQIAWLRKKAFSEVLFLNGIMVVCGNFLFKNMTIPMFSSWILCHFALIK